MIVSKQEFESMVAASILSGEAEYRTDNWGQIIIHTQYFEWGNGIISDEPHPDVIYEKNQMYEVWDQEYNKKKNATNNFDTSEVVYYGTKEQCEKFMDPNPDGRFYMCVVEDEE